MAEPKHGHGILIIGLKAPGTPGGGGPGSMVGHGMPGKPASRDANGDQQRGDNEGDESIPVDPAWVDYHTGEERCEACQMFDGGHCSLLKMEVDPAGHCEAFTGGQGGYGSGSSDNDGDEGMMA